MKRVLIYTFVSIALLFTACVNSGDEITPTNGSTTLTISLEQTRTVLGNKEGESYPVYWSEGDKIAINGKCSTPATINAENKSCATFTIEEEIKAPYCVTYPYTEATTSEEPMVLFPAEQSYTEGTFSLTDLFVIAFHLCRG